MNEPVADAGGWKADARATLDALLARHAGTRGALLPLLHDVQHSLGFIPPAAVPMIADALNLSRAEVHGVLNFYTDFRDRPAGRHVIKLCQAESCQARGSAAVTADLAERLGIGLGETRADGQVTLEPVYCLGLCAIGPNALVDDRPVGALDAAKVAILAARLTS